MQRVVVLGCAGSGKTTFARLLGPVIGAEVVHLDRLFWKPRWVESSPDELRAAQEPYLALDRWVIDGNYSSSHEERLEQADTIVLLDLPRPLCLWRVLVRTALNRGRTRADIAKVAPTSSTSRFSGGSGRGRAAACRAGSSESSATARAG